METLDLRALNRATLARQLLLARESVTPLAAIERLVGLQAQAPRPPFVGLWTRLKDFKREDLLRLLKQKKVVRATALRGTLHLLSARDFLALRGALQPALDWAMQSLLRERAKGLDVPALTEAATGFFDRQPATFDALRDHLVARYPKGDDRAMGFAVRCCLPLVQVPNDERWGFPSAPPFAVAERWLGEPVDPEQKPHALVLRYLAAFGPATATDAQCWSALRGLKEAFEALRPKLVTFRDDRKRELFDLPRAPRPGPDADAAVRLLPDFDNLVLSHEDRRRVLADAHRSAVVTKNLLVRATFLVDGFVAGTWKVERKKAAATVVLEPFGALPPKSRRALEEEALRLLEWVEEDAAQRSVRVQK